MRRRDPGGFGVVGLLGRLLAVMLLLAIVAGWPLLTVMLLVAFMLPVFVAPALGWLIDYEGCRTQRDLLH